MSDNRKLADNVNKFLFDAAESFGRIKADQFSQDIFCQLVDGKNQSPIEDLFFIACHVLCASRYTEINPDPSVDNNGAESLGCGVFVHPQCKIGKYRVDFLITQNGIGPDYALSPVVVELDGHDFHDKDKAQRAYEKGRDRFLVKSGYKVLHFTGSEVVADPYRVAYEALELVGFNTGWGDDEYNPDNPLGIE